MSYDILIFEPAAVSDEEFPQWWEQVSRWEEPRDYDTTEGSTPAIRAFYRDLIRAFPPFNGPDALSDAELEEREEQGLPWTTVSMVGVRWSAADALVVTISELAQR